MQTLTPYKGYSLIEVLGTLAVVAVLIAIALPYYKNNNAAAKQEAATYNAKILNLSTEKYNLSGIRVVDPLDPTKKMVLNLTADVPRPGTVVGLSAIDLPETLAVGLLRAEFTDAVSGNQAGPFIPAYLKPVFSSDANDYRVVWINELTALSPPGRFEAVGPTGQSPTAFGLPNDVPGIIALTKDGIDGSGSYSLSTIRQTGGTGGLNPIFTDTTNPSLGGTTYTINLDLGSIGGGTVSPATASSADAQIAYRADPSPGYTFSHWDGALSGRPAIGTLFPTDPAFPKTSNKTARAYFSPTGATAGTGLNELSIQVTNPQGGTVDGAGEYNTALTANATATANPGYVFSGWTGDKNTSAITVILSPEDFLDSTTPGLITLVAHFTVDPTTQEGGESTPAPIETATPEPTAVPTATPVGWTPTPMPTPIPSPASGYDPVTGFPVTPVPTATPSIPQSGGTINLWGEGIMAHLGAETNLRMELYNDNTNPPLTIGLSSVVVVIPDGFEIISFNNVIYGQNGSTFNFVQRSGNTITWIGSLQGGEHMESLIRIKGITPGNYSATLNTSSDANDGNRSANRSLFVPQYYPLAMTVQTSSNQVNVNGSIEFIAEIQNNNDAPAPAMPNVTFLLPVPAGLTVTNPTATTGTVTVVGNSLQWTGSLPYGMLRITGQLNGISGGNYNLTGELTSIVNAPGSTNQTISVQVVENFYNDMSVQVGGASPYFSGQQQTITTQVNSGSTAPGMVYLTTMFPDSIVFNGVQAEGNTTFLGSNSGGGYTWVVFAGTLAAFSQLQPVINITPSAAGTFDITSKVERASGSIDISANTSFSPAPPSNPFNSMTVEIGGVSPYVAGQQQTLTVQVNTGNFAPGTAYLTIVMPASISYDSTQNAGDLTFANTSTSGGLRYVVFTGTLNSNTQYQPVILVTPSEAGNFTILANAERVPGVTDLSASTGFSPSSIVYSPFGSGYNGKGNPSDINGAGITGDMDVQFQNQQAANVPFTVVTTPTNATMANGNTVTGTAPAWTSTQLESLLGFTSTGANPSFVIRIYRTGQGSPDQTYNVSW